MTRRSRTKTAPKANPRRRLRKQPKMRRIDATALMRMPNAVVDDTARNRRKRNKRRWQASAGTSLRQLALSSRWLSLTLLLVCVYALQFVGLNDQFYITYIPVEGVTSIPPDEIVAASGLAGAHIFSVDPIEAAERIRSIPNVLSASVTLNWPNEVTVSVLEETPMAEWVQAGQSYWISESGQLMTARTTLPGLLRIVSETPGDLVAEDGTFTQTFVPPEVLAAAFELREMYPELDSFFYDAANGVSFNDGRGWRVYFGTGTDMDQKRTVYDALVVQLDEAGVQPEYVSVSNQARPFYRAQGTPQ